MCVLGWSASRPPSIGVWLRPAIRSHFLHRSFPVVGQRYLPPERRANVDLGAGVVRAIADGNLGHPPNQQAEHDALPGERQDQDVVVLEAQEGEGRQEGPRLGVRRGGRAGVAPVPQEELGRQGSGTTMRLCGRRGGFRSLYASCNFLKSTSIFLYGLIYFETAVLWASVARLVSRQALRWARIAARTARPEALGPVQLSVGRAVQERVLQVVRRRVQGCLGDLNSEEGGREGFQGYGLCGHGRVKQLQGAAEGQRLLRPGRLARQAVSRWAKDD